MDSAVKSKNAKKKPFKWTRELVKMALNDGWTQLEIADKCRTQQSIVSAWKRGSKQGTEEQLLPLLNIYGHKLRRNAYKVYWSLNTETLEKTFYRVEGKVIFAQAFCDPRRDKSGKLVKKIPEYKLVVHHQGADQYLVVHQSRIKFTNSKQEIENQVEDAIWSSKILETLTSNDLIRFVDNYAVESLNNYPSDAQTLPFLIRQALIHHGVPVEGVIEYPAAW
ncbi:hypothetical protein [Arsukibacterium sp. UBA3155]|uniref:hypothetical protein n=1 Tax=Arsukibacterium sp. UBA3155 TaxID=1946058 RepID=UPI0025BB005D|nr:hypothetical protein [Arsukibacterium sp. UBA3155]|tara:strand:+ start:144206 stop:144871 length:666 start_codon:yes stop_codon:yes gene_type:complete